jgi:hypothetical protein
MRATAATLVSLLVMKASPLNLSNRLVEMELGTFLAGRASAVKLVEFF